MRALVVSRLSADPTFSAIVPPSRVFATAGFEEAPQERPFAILRWGEQTPSPTPAVRRQLALWVYDEPGSYIARIEPALAAAKAVIAGLPGAAHGNGHVINVDYQGDSGDLYDDIFRAIMRNASWVLVGSGY